MRTTRPKKPEKVSRKKPLNFPPRQIPKHVLARTLEIVNNPNDEFWLNKSSSCRVPINHESNDLRQSDSVKKLNIARRCLLTRDWKNLAKLLTSNLIGDSPIQKSSFHILSEVNKLNYHLKMKLIMCYLSFQYASVLLTLENPTLLEKLQQTMTPNPNHPSNKGKLKKEAVGEKPILKKLA